MLRNSKAVACQTEKAVWNQVIRDNAHYKYMSDARDRDSSRDSVRQFKEYAGDSDDSERLEQKREERRK